MKIEMRFFEGWPECYENFRSKHFSAALMYRPSLDKGPDEYTVEIISFQRNGELCHQSLTTFRLVSLYHAMRIIEVSYLLLALEDQVKSGKTAKQVLADSSKKGPTIEEWKKFRSDIL